MPAPSTCTVSGTCYGPGAVALSGVVVKAYITTGFTDGSGNFLPAGVLASTTTDSSGAWSLAVIRTAGLGHSITFQFEMPLGNNQSKSLKYAAVIPDAATANFSDLVNMSTGTAALAAAPTTDALPEGSLNLYFTTARAAAAAPVSSVAGRTGAIVLTTDDVAEGTNLYYTNARSDARIALQRAAANGLASLDSASKIPIAQLPSSVLEYKGTWNASTNTPTLADGTGVSGYFYRVSVAGTQNLGSGSLTFVVGDWVAHNGSIWELTHSGSDIVQSVNGQTGAVVLTKSDVGLGNVSNLSSTSAATASTVMARDNSGNTAVNKIQGTGDATTPAFWVDTGGGSSGFYFGSSGTTFLYNTGEIFSFAASVFKANVPIQAAFNSSASTPGIFLSTDSHSGFYKIGTNNWGWSANSSKVLDMSTTGLAVTGALSATGAVTGSNLSGTNTGDQTITLTGDVTGSGTGSFAATIGASKVTNSMLAGSIDLTSKVTGALPIANGGTGQTSKATGFDALSPMTTSGDVIYGGASGTGTRLAKGTDGQVLTLASGIPSWATASGGSVGTHSVRVGTGNGSGSTNTKIRRFSASYLNTGTAITYADSATLGGTFTINEAGVYAITYQDAATSGAAVVGISLNSTQLTTAIYSITATDMLVLADATSNGNRGTCSVTVHLAVNDVIRAHHDGAANETTAAWTRFTITKVSA